MTENDLLLEIEREGARRLATVRAMLIEEGREDLALELDAKLRDIRLGLDSARAVWHSISPAQRGVLLALEAGRKLRRQPGSRTRYDAIGEPDAPASICGLATARALCAHELLHPDGGAFDPEAVFRLTERGRFVLSKGRPDA